MLPARDPTRASRICIIRHYYYPEELSTRRQAEYFAEIGHEVDIVCSRRSRAEPLRDRVNGVNVYRLPISHQRKGVVHYVLEYLAFFLTAIVQLSWLHLRKRYDAIQVNTMPDFLVFVTLFPRLLGARVVLFMQEPMPEAWITKFGLDAFWKRQGYRLVVWSEQLSLHYAQRVLTVTEQLKEAYVGRGAQADKITVILNVPDTQLLERFSSADIPDDSTFELICHGSIEERYGQDVAIRAISLLREEIPNIRLNILGWGEYEPALQRLAEELGLQEQVRFYGFVPLEDMIRAIRRAHVGLVPVRRNAYSDLVHTNKMFEFMAMRKPIIISRTRAVEAYFDDSSLAFFEPGDAHDLARAIRELYHDPQRREALAANARKAFEPYRWEYERLKCLQVFEELLGQEMV